MKSSEELRVASNKIRLICLDAVTTFAQQNPDIPAQAVMIGVGEFLVQFSVSHVGSGSTIHLLSSLQDIVSHLDTKG